MLSHSAANTLDADADDLGVTTRNLCGYLIAPVSVLVVPDLWTALPEAVLVLQAVRVFVDKCGGVPTEGRLNRVDFAPEVLRALRASVGRRMATFITKDTLERGGMRGEANVEKVLKEREEVRGIPPKGLEKEAKRLMNVEGSGGGSADSGARGKSAVVDVDLGAVSRVGRSAEEEQKEEGGDAMEDVEVPDWNISFTQADVDVDVDVGADADAEIGDEAFGESLPLTQHYSCNEEEMEGVGVELGPNGRATTGAMSRRERKKRALDSMVDEYWDAMHDEHGVFTDITKNIEKITTADKRDATTKGHNASSDAPLQRVWSAFAESPPNDRSQSAEMGKTLGTDRAESPDLKAASNSDAVVAPDTSATVQHVVVTEELSVREKKIVEKNIGELSRPETRSDAARGKDEVIGGTVGDNKRKEVEINVESAVTRIDVQVSTEHVSIEQSKEQTVQSDATKEQKGTTKGTGTDVSGRKSAAQKNPAKDSTERVADSDTMMAETEPPEPDELDEITPVEKKKAAINVKRTPAAEEGEIRPVVKAGSKRKGPEDGLDERNRKPQRELAQEEKRDMSVLQKLRREVELVRGFRKAVDDDPVGYIYMPDTFLPSLLEDKERKAKEGILFPPPDLSGEGPEKPSQLLNVPESAPI